MATQTPETHEQILPQPPPVAAAQPAGFSAVARRVTGWTTNLLASALILVMTIATGRQVSQWLRAEPPDAPGQHVNLETDLLGHGWNDGELHVLEFGESQHPVQRAEVRVQFTRRRFDGSLGPLRNFARRLVHHRRDD